MRHIFMPDDQTTKNYSSHANYLFNESFNPIHVATKTELIGLLQQSIPFHIDLVYILVHFPKLSLINFVALNTEKSSTLHTIILRNKQSHCLDFHLSIFFF